MEETNVNIGELNVSDETKEFLMYRQTWLKKMEEVNDAINQHYALTEDPIENTCKVLQSTGIKNRRKLNAILNESQTAGMVSTDEASHWKQAANKMELPL